ncbi:unnamed protein product [Clavelina lepadiformis]|uniref:Acid ceramidase-like protein n=1 Tax=Clavelina lepadiformis TaxID=159417 RepID=A0ABP0GSF1_CLALP
MKFLLLWLFFVASAWCGVLASECNGKPDADAQPNMNPINKAAPKLVASIKNGKLYKVPGNSVLNVLHVWGTPYEMGYAHGTLLKKEASMFMNQVWDYLEEQVIEAINGSVKWNFRDWFLRDVANLGVEAACDLEVLATAKYSGPYFLEEIKGLADATGLDYKKILRIHMLGELTKGSCSMFGAWGSMLPYDGVLQLRSLDWNMDGPFKNYPQITVYHPTSDQTDANGMKAQAFVNVGWTAWIGSITGVSSAKLAISEIGVSFPDATFGKESRFGVPFTYILRDILQFDYTLDDAVNRIANAHRTCDLILGVGDGKENRGFRGVQYSAGVSNFFDDQNMKPSNESWHPKIKDAVYFGMDWLCPGYNVVLAQQLQKYHGKLTAEIAIRDVVSIIQSGSTHIAIYDLTHDLMYVSFSKSDSESGPKAAYDRQFIQLDTDALFAVSSP